MKVTQSLEFDTIESLFLYSLLSSEFVEKNRSFHYIKYIPWDKTIPKVHSYPGGNSFSHYYIKLLQWEKTIPITT